MKIKIIYQPTNETLEKCGNRFFTQEQMNEIVRA